MPIYDLYPLKKLLEAALENPETAEENIQKALKIVTDAIDLEIYEGEDFR